MEATTNFDNEAEEKLTEENFKILFKQPKLDKYNKNDVITNPNEVKEIIKYLEKQGDSEILISNKMKIIRRLILLVGGRFNNSLVLNAMAKGYSKTPRSDSVQLIMNSLFANTFSTDSELYEKHQHICENLLILLKKIVSGFRFKKKHFEELYAKLLEKKTQGESKFKTNATDDGDTNKNAQLFEKKSIVYESNLYAEKIWIALEIINSMLCSDSVFKGPQNFIYFNGFNSGISTFKKQFDKNPFVKSFCISLWFRMEDLKYNLEDYNALLFSFVDNDIGGFEAYFIENQLYYRSITGKYSPPNENSSGVMIGAFDPEEWYYLSICHEKKMLGRSDVKAVINGKQVLSMHVDFPKADKINKFSSAYIARHFCGQISTVIIYKETVSVDKFKKIYQEYPLGLYLKEQANSINSLSVFEGKLLSRILLLYTPVRSTPNVGVWDLIGNNYGTLENNTGVIALEDFHDQLLYCGGLNGLLPILNIIKNRILCVEQGQRLLHRYLEIVSCAIKCINGQPEIKSKFIRTFFLLLEHTPRDFFQIKSIQQLAEIRFVLPQECNEEFFKCLVHSADIWINCNSSIQKEFWAFVNDIYLQDPTYFNYIISIPELIDYTLRLSEIKEGVNQGVAKSGLQIQSKTGEIKDNESMKDLSFVLGVVEKLFIKGGENISENVKYLIPALTSKASSTFKFEILRLLKVLLVDTKDDTHCPSPLTFAEHFIDNHGMHVLLYLCINSSLDVTSMCFKLIDVLSSLKKSKKLAIDTDIIPFLSNIILSKIKIKHGVDQIGNSGKTKKNGKFDLLPKINEELEANINHSKEHPFKRVNSSEAFDTTDDIQTEECELLHTSTQKFSNAKFGLDIDVDEANKHFNRANICETDELLIPDNTEEDYSLNLKGKEIASKFQKDIMFDRSIMKQTKEVPPGPKSKSVPRNQDFFSNTHNKEEVKGPPGVKANKRGFNFMLLESKESDDIPFEEDKDSQNILMSESGAPKSKDKIKGVIKKRFAFLNTDEDKEEEKEEHEEIFIEKKNKLVLNPAATGATEFQSDSSSERSEILNFKGKAQFKKPIINTEAINEMFTYGGEKGDLLIRLDDDEEENAIFLKELNDIATICVAAMNRSSPDEEIVLETEESGNQEEIEYTLKANNKK